VADTDEPRSTNYRDAGVDIVAGADAVDRIRDAIGAAD
jgi:phosphoribosylaminoimidazole (AIR) synthetase